MMKIINCFLILSIILVTSCNQSSSSKDDHGATSEESSNIESTPESILLNDGKKWVVDAPMMVAIRNMEKAVQNFSSSNPETMMDDYKKLSNMLAENVEYLTSNCTMTGQSHDELHKWLVPYIALTEQMAAAKTPDEAATVLNDLLTSISEFNTFFE